MQVHESSQPITRCKAWQPRAGNAVDRFWFGYHVDAMAVVQQNRIGKNIEITFKLRPSIHNHIAKLFMGASRYQVGTILVEIVPPFLKKLGSPKLHFYRMSLCSKYMRYRKYDNDMLTSDHVL